MANVDARPGGRRRSMVETIFGVGSLGRGAGGVTTAMSRFGERREIRELDVEIAGRRRPRTAKPRAAYPNE